MKASDRAVLDTFVHLTDILVTGFDLIDFLDSLAERTVRLLDVDTCGVLLADHNGRLSVVAASTEHTRLLEFLQLQNAEGPGHDCFHSGQNVTCTDLSDADDRWPVFAPAARANGFSAVHTVPLRLRETIIGAMNLFSSTGGELDEQTVDLSRTLADLAAIGIVHERAVRRQEVLAEQLQFALNSRILLEQAKGVLAERHGVSVDDAFKLLLEHVRSTGLHLLEASHRVVAGTLALRTDDETDGIG